MPRSGDERRAYLDDVIVTAGMLQVRLKPGIAIAVLRDGPSPPSARHREGIVPGAVEPSPKRLIFAQPVAELRDQIPPPGQPQPGAAPVAAPAAAQPQPAAPPALPEPIPAR